jgi:tetratricopeptide (TPR) repeat protein
MLLGGQSAWVGLAALPVAFLLYEHARASEGGTTGGLSRKARAILAPVALAPFGIALLSGEFGYAAALAFLPAGLMIRAPSRRGTVDRREILQGERDLASVLPERFFPVRSYIEARASLATSEGTAVAWAFISGPPGSGKTAAAHALSCSLRRDLGPSTALMEAQGAVSTGQPLGMVSAALAGAVPEAGSDESSGEVLESVATELIRHLVPLAGAVIEHKSRAPTYGTRQEMVLAMVRAFEDTATNRPVIVVLDDVHLADTGSLEVFEALAHRVTSRSSGRMYFIITAAGAQCPFHLPAGCVKVDLGQLSRDDLLGVLEAAGQLTTPEAGELLDWAGPRRLPQGGIRWLLAVADAVRAETSLAQAGGKVKIPLLERLRSNPRLGSLESMIAAAASATAKRADVMTAAICAGMRFEAGIVSRVLERDQLDILLSLSELQREAGVIEEDPDTVGAFRFESPAEYELLRRHFLGGGAQSRLWLARECHRRLAIELASRLPPSWLNQVKTGEYQFEPRLTIPLVFEVAGHALEAGLLSTEPFQTTVIEAAWGATALFDFGRAGSLMSRGERLLRAEAPAFVLEAVALRCYIAHVTGEGLKEASNEAVALLESEQELPIAALMTIGHALHAAARTDLIDRDSGLSLLVRRLEEATDDLEARVGALFWGATAFSLAGSESRALERLDEAIHCLETPGSSAPLSRRLRSLEAQVYNAAGFALIRRGAPGDTDRARRLLARAVDCNTNLTPPNLPGLARCYGGLSHLALQKRPPEYTEAENWFQKDLEISREIGDRAGQSRMFSLLGECALGRAALDTARERYLQSIELATAPADQRFSVAGLLNVLVQRDEDDTIGTWLKRAGELLDGATGPGTVELRAITERARKVHLPRMTSP